MGDGYWNPFWQADATDDATQAEINTTKTLLTVLRDSAPAAETTFLELLWEAAPGTLPTEHTIVDYEREIASKTPKADESYLVGIARKVTPFDAATLDAVKESDGRPDAAVTVETPRGRFRFILEVKTGRSRLSSIQLGKYCNKFGIEPENVATIRWYDIYRELQAVCETTTDEVTNYLLTQLTEYLALQNLNREVGVIDHSGYEKSIYIDRTEEDHGVVLKARESGSSDIKRFTNTQFIELFEALFDALGLDESARRSIFLEANASRLAKAVDKTRGQEVAATTNGFQGDARIRVAIEDHGSEAGLLKFQYMRKDGGFGEFPNSYHVMMTDWELFEMVHPDTGPGLSETTRKALFVDIDPSVRHHIS
ncbi:hypothetical protein [Haloglomus litoreum]|uniref:hypothetical protein n=1 Tax=Haloglomus litoreum TaxID=3034026 RepID=UPI0023E77BBA|nr:hypothetical protein [Haloglomus sp. DT116]